MQRYFTKSLVNDYFTLSEDDKYHILVVMRMKPNDKIEIVYNNNLYIGIIEDIVDFKVKLYSKEGVLPKKDINIVMCIPLLKEQKMDYVLQKATELGVNEIIPVILERSIIKLDEEKEAKKLLRWEKIVKEASEQSKRIDIPKIHKVTQIDDLEFDGLKIICSTFEKEKTIKKVLKNNNVNNIMFIIGPEGGISLKEEKALVNQGFIPVTLGHRIMRVETVPLYIMSIINYEFME